MELRTSLSHEAVETYTDNFKMRLDRLLDDKVIIKAIKTESKLLLWMFTSQGYVIPPV